MSDACCTLPPVQAEYTPKGTYTTINEIKTYSVGPEDSKGVIVFIYDVFGFSPQTIQGADLIASQGIRVVMPDLLGDHLATADMYSGTDEANAKRAKFLNTFPGAVTSQLDRMSPYISALKSAGHAKVGALGACWGYKVAMLSGDQGWDAIAAVHPSYAENNDADKVNVPICLLPSKNEDMDVMNKVFAAVEKKLPGKSWLKEYPTMAHGWCATRANLKDEENVKQYHDAYTTVSHFYKDIFA